jgi:hypothetical protein
VADTYLSKTTRKLRKIRADVDQELAKEYQREVQEETGETEEEKRLAKRRAEDKRRALLSPEEQKRVSEDAKVLVRDAFMRLTLFLLCSSKRKTRRRR